MTRLCIWWPTGWFFIILSALVTVMPCRAQIIGRAPAKSYDSCLVFSPDGKQLLAGANDGSVDIFETSSREKIGSFFTKKYLSELLFSPKGDMVAGFRYKWDDVFLFETKNSKDWKSLP